MKDKKLWMAEIFVLLLVLSSCGGRTAINASTNDKNQSSMQDNAEQDNSVEEIAHEEAFTLKVANQFPESNTNSKDISGYFMGKAKELSDGRLQFDFFPGEQLGKANQMIDIVQNKTSDISTAVAGTVSDKLPLTDIAQLPNKFLMSTEASEGIWEISNGILLQSFLEQGIRPLFIAGAMPSQVFTAIDKQIVGVADWRGLKIRTTGGIQDLIVSSLGGTPVSMGSPELYSALERKTVDGAILPFSSWPPYQIETLAKHATTNASLGNTVILLTINEEVFQGLSDDLQEVLTQAGLETVQHYVQVQDELYTKFIDDFAEQGIDMYELTEAQISSWTEELAPVTKHWIENMNNRGLPGQEVVNAYNEAIANGISWE